MGAVASTPLVDVRADFHVLAREFGGRRVAYLDSAATSQRPEQVIAAMDARGAWVESGRLRYHGKDDGTREVIESATFIRNIGVLSRYVGGRER